MTAKIYAAIPWGFGGELVEVEGDMNKGLPAFNIVGMANKTVSEAKERVRSATVNSGFSFPRYKLTINLAPAELLKDGAYLDLPIALSVLALSGQLVESDVKGRLFVGELSLSGEIRPVKGIINIIEVAKRAGIREAYVPIDNLAQAALVKGMKIYGVATLKSLFLALKSQCKLPEATEVGDIALKAKKAVKGLKNGNAGDSRVADKENTGARATRIQRVNRGSDDESGPLLDQIRGQKLAKRAIEVAIAGHHNLLISGPPGAGKTLLAKAAANLLPELTPEEKVALTKIYSLAGVATDEVVERRPFRNPHHTASATSIIGGGALAGPGEISLAHKGILFLDEIPEFPRGVLEALRQPMEDKKVAISRINRKTVYPADFMLVATMNPCPCGYLGDPTHECTCSEVQIQNYQRKLSGPLFDRIDMCIEVERVGNEDLRTGVTEGATRGGGAGPSEHDVVKNTITGAIERQKARYGEGVFNSSLSSFQVANLIKLTQEAEKLLAAATEKLNLSARAYFKTIKVAQTIADLEGEAEVGAEHLTEALRYRRRER